MIFRIAVSIYTSRNLCLAPNESDFVHRNRGTPDEFGSNGLAFRLSVRQFNRKEAKNYLCLRFMSSRRYRRFLLGQSVFLTGRPNRERGKKNGVVDCSCTIAIANDRPPYSTLSPKSIGRGVCRAAPTLSSCKPLFGSHRRDLCLPHAWHLRRFPSELE